MDNGQLGSWGDGGGVWRTRAGLLCDGIAAYLMYHNVMWILWWEGQLEMNVLWNHYNEKKGGFL